MVNYQPQSAIGVPWAPLSGKGYEALLAIRLLFWKIQIKHSYRHCYGKSTWSSCVIDWVLQGQQQNHHEQKAFAPKSCARRHSMPVKANLCHLLHFWKYLFPLILFCRRGYKLFLWNLYLVLLSFHFCFLFDFLIVFHSTLEIKPQN